MSELSMSKQERDDFLAAVHVGVLAVERPDGPPLATPVWYRYTPGGAVEFNTQRSSVKTELLERAGRATICVQREELPYAYVTVEGPVEIEATDRATRVDIATRYLGAGDGDGVRRRWWGRRRHRRAAPAGVISDLRLLQARQPWRVSRGDPILRRLRPAQREEPSAEPGCDGSRPVAGATTPAGQASSRLIIAPTSTASDDGVAGDLDDRVVAVVVLEAQRPADDGVHLVHARDVRELEDRLVGEVRLELLEQGVGDAPVAADEGVGVGEDDPLTLVEQVARRPARDRRDLLLADADGAARLAVLGEDELAAAQPAGAGLAELAQRRLDEARPGCGRGRSRARRGGARPATGRTPSTSRPASRSPSPARPPGRGRARTAGRTSAASARRRSRGG